MKTWIVTLNEREEKAVADWRGANPAWRATTRPVSLMRQGNVSSAIELSRRLRGQGRSPFDFIVVYACAGLPKQPIRVDGRPPRLGDAFVVTEAHYCEVGQVSAVPAAVGTPTPTVPVDAVFLRDDKAPGHFDLHAAPRGIRKLALGLPSAQNVPGAGTSVSGAIVPHDIRLHGQSVAFCSDKVVKRGGATSPVPPRTTSSGAALLGYGETLGDVIASAQIHAVEPKPVVVDMEAFGLLEASGPYADRVVVCRVATDWCEGKDVDDPALVVSPDEMQLAFLENATSALEMLITHLRTRLTPGYFADMLVRRVIAKVAAGA